jgi:tRNA(adenine34) deaminase
MQLDEHYMREAIAEARRALEHDDVPVGAVVVRNDEIIARAHNRREELQEPTAHAEIVALREAAQVVGTWYLTDVTVYVTKEPCPMCAGAFVLARVPRVVFGAFDPKMGAGGSVVNLLQEARFNHRVEVAAGVLAEECGRLLREFFEKLRSEQ